MQFGTISFEGKIYNLDMMESSEIEVLLKKVKESKNKDF
jgi:hypothetical protein